MEDKLQEYIDAYIDSGFEEGLIPMLVKDIGKVFSDKVSVEEVLKYSYHYKTKYTYAQNKNEISKEELYSVPINQNVYRATINYLIGIPCPKSENTVYVATGNLTPIPHHCGMHVLTGFDDYCGAVYKRKEAVSYLNNVSPGKEFILLAQEAIIRAEQYRERTTLFIFTKATDESIINQLNQLVKCNYNVVTDFMNRNSDRKNNVFKREYNEINIRKYRQRSGDLPF